MNIVAYITLRPYLFADLVPRLEKEEDCKVLPVNIAQILSKLAENNSDLRSAFAAFWDYIFSIQKYDILWSYQVPDEITAAKCRQYGVTIILQEYFGHYPFELPALFPAFCDYNKAYKNIETETLKTEAVENPTITVAVEELFFPENKSIESIFLRNGDKSMLQFEFYWDTDIMTSSRFHFMKMVMDIVKSNDDLKSCPLKFRPKPCFAKHLSGELGFVERLKDPGISIDYSPLESALQNGHIAISIHSKFGIDALRAANELIVYGTKSFYGNPCLAFNPQNPEEMELHIKKAVQKMRKEGKHLKGFLKPLAEDMKGPLACKCEEPYEKPEQLKKALKFAAAMPLLENWRNI